VAVHSWRGEGGVINDRRGFILYRMLLLPSFTLNAKRSEVTVERIWNKGRGWKEGLCGRERSSQIYTP
jgi:hypothetical protein